MLLQASVQKLARMIRAHLHGAAADPPASNTNGAETNDPDSDSDSDSSDESSSAVLPIEARFVNGDAETKTDTVGTRAPMKAGVLATPTT